MRAQSALQSVLLLTLLMLASASDDDSNDLDEPISAVAGMHEPPESPK